MSGPNLYDRVRETTTSTGTATISLGGAQPGYRTFSSTVGTGNTCYYCIVAPNGDWEEGIGTVTSGSPDTLSRTTVLASSAGGGSVSFGTGVKDVFLPLPASRAVYLDSTAPLAADPDLADLVPIYDSSAAAVRSATLARLGAALNPAIFQARLTLTTGTPVTTSDVSGASAGTLYLTPFGGNRVAIHDGTRWVEYALSEISLSLASLVAGTTYDVFLNDGGTGTPTLTTFNWTNPSTGAITGATNATPIVITSTAHGLTADQVVYISGVGGNAAANGVMRVGTVAANTFQLLTLAGASVAGSGAYTSGGTWWRIDQNTARLTSLTTQDGVLVRTGGKTDRYVGTIRIYQTGQCEDAQKRRFLQNCYNTVRRELTANATGSHTYTTGSWRFWNNDLTPRAEWVDGLGYNSGYFSIGGDVTGGAGFMSMGFDTTIGTTPSVRNVNAALVEDGQSRGRYVGSGYHWLSAVEFGAAGFTCVAVTVTGLIDC